MLVHLDVLPKYDPRAAGLRLEYVALQRALVPTVLKPYDYFEDESLVVFATEWIDGRRLRNLSSATVLNTDAKVQILVDVASALDAAHRRSVIHRGLNSDCVLVRTCAPATAQPRVKVRGFDARRPMDPFATIDSDEALAESAYDAPELLVGQAPDTRTDIYAFGVLAFELFTGALPYAELPPLEAAVIRVHHGVPVLEASDAAPRWASELVAGCTDANPKKRFTSMLNVRRFIETSGNAGGPRRSRSALELKLPGSRARTIRRILGVSRS